MSDISWIKLMTTIFDDQKIKLLMKMPEGKTMTLIWIRLLVEAGKTNDNGWIYMDDDIPYSAADLANLFDEQQQLIEFTLEVLSRKFRMIEFDDIGRICIVNWEKHQNVDGMSKIKEQNRLRQQKRRERLRAEKKNKELPPARTESDEADQSAAAAEIRQASQQAAASHEDTPNVSRDSHATVTPHHAIEKETDLDPDLEDIFIPIHKSESNYEYPLLKTFTDVMGMFNLYNIEIVKGVSVVNTIENYRGIKMEDSLIIKAMELSYGKNDQYCLKIIENWLREGYTTIETHPDYKTKAIDSKPAKSKASSNKYQGSRKKEIPIVSDTSGETVTEEELEEMIRFAEEAQKNRAAR